jgi:hypothetical protein
MSFCGELFGAAAVVAVAVYALSPSDTTLRLRREQDAKSEMNLADEEARRKTARLIARAEAIRKGGFTKEDIALAERSLAEPWPYGDRD